MIFFRYRKLDKLSEAELAAQYKKTLESRYLEALFNRCFHLVYGVCLKYLKDKDESKEAVMLIFEKFEKDILQNQIDNLNAWLYTVSRNKCLTIIRDKKRKEGLNEPLENVSLYTQDLINSEETLEKEELLVRLEDCLRQLKPEQRDCVKLFFLDKKTYKEISIITGYEEKQVKSYLQNGKRSLSLLFTQDR
jgi:RNA polymerase sigma factor (sigma-70 family)